MPTSPNMKVQNRRMGRTGWNLILPLGAFAILSGCSADRMTTSSIPMDDYRNRHPIVLAEEARKLDIFPAPESRGLDRHTAAQVAEFGKLYKNVGHGPINVFVPVDGRGAEPRYAINAIHRALAAGGAAAPLQITNYPVVNRDLASPIRLSFIGLKSKVADPCGQWPSDLASGSTTQGWENKPYWNFGCSYQSMIAEQIADPRDLVAPHAEDPPDTQMRNRGIADMRKGTDPTTDWKTKNTSISTIGSN